MLIKTDLNYGIFLAIAAAFLVWFILNRTTRGYEMRAVGSGSEAARFAGINVNKNIILSLAFAGALQVWPAPLSSPAPCLTASPPLPPSPVMASMVSRWR
ncbi:MAG: hypothetical protein V8Q30_06805 [Acutalibacteraceae bacterium]